MNFAIKTVGLYGRINSNEKIMSRPRMEGLATHYLRILAYCIERSATVIVRRQAISALNASFHVRGPLTAGALP